MQNDDETELKDALVETLEKNGTLAKIKAQLRAAVFLALEEQPKFLEKPPLLSQETKDLLESEEGVTSAAVVQDFLQQLEMKSTLSVFLREIGNATSTSLANRTQLTEKLLSNGPSDPEKPILFSLAKKTHAAHPLLGARAEIPIIGEKSSLPKLEEKKIEPISSFSFGSDKDAESEKDDFFDEPVKPPIPQKLDVTKTDSLSKSMEFDTSPLKPTPMERNVGQSGRSLLGKLPELPSVRPGGSSLPPLGNAPQTKQSDLAKVLSKDSNVLTDSSESSSSESTAKSSSRPNGDKPVSRPSSAEKRLEKQNATTSPTPSKNGPVEQIFKKASPRGDSIADSVSEEIAEDLEVDELLDSARSSEELKSF